jgi:hypothetical protein
MIKWRKNTSACFSLVNESLTLAAFKLWAKLRTAD